MKMVGDLNENVGAGPDANPASRPRVASNRCPECGARLDAGADRTGTRPNDAGPTAEDPSGTVPTDVAKTGIPSCEELFHAALALEWTDPPRTYRAHHALVITYMVQHSSRLSPEAEAEYKDALVALIDEGLSGEQLRRRHELRFDQGRRAWNVAPAEPRPVQARTWSATIVDVLSGPIDELPERIMAWARAVRTDLREAM